MISEIILLVKSFLNRLKKDNVSAFSAQAAFFIIMSVVPFLSLLLTLLKYLPISTAMVKNAVLNISPTPFEPMALVILDELLAKTNGAVLSVSFVVALWSAAKGVMAIINGLKSVYHMEDKKNYFLIRLISSIYTVVFVVAIIVTLLLIVFGNTIYNMAKRKFPFAAGILSVFVEQKFILAFCILTLFFFFVYQLVKRENNAFVYIIPGAVFSAFTWIAFSHLFSIYINKFSDFSYTYGSLATIILLMLWVYVCMYLLFIGAELNVGIQTYVTKVKSQIKKKEI